MLLLDLQLNEDIKPAGASAVTSDSLRKRILPKSVLMHIAAIECSMQPNTATAFALA